MRIRCGALSAPEQDPLVRGRRPRRPFHTSMRLISLSKSGSGGPADQGVRPTIKACFRGLRCWT
jgi:hypothetical protein